MMLLVLLLGIVLLIFFYLVGSLFLQKSIKTERPFLQHVVNLWVGLLLVVSAYAIAKTALVTILILVPLILFYFRRYFVVEAGGKIISSLQFILFSAVLYAFFYFIQVNFNLGFLTDPVPYLSYIHPKEDERHIYSTIISFLHYEGVETVSSESILHGTSGVSLYHFVEFWLASFFKLFYNEKSDIVLFYFVYPLFKTFTVLAVCSIFSDRVTSRTDLLLVGAIVLCFVILGLKMVFAPVYRMAIRDILFVPILVLASKTIILRKYEVSLALLMIASVENILFMPALVVFLLIFYGRLQSGVLMKGIVFFLLYAVFFYLFKEKANDKYFSLGISNVLEVIFSFKTLQHCFRTLLGAVLSYPMRILLCFLVVSYMKGLKNRDFHLRFDAWLIGCFFAYNIAFSFLDNLSIDANQLQILVNILISISFFFVLYYFLEKRLLVVCVTLLLLISDYSYPFGKIEVAYGYDKELERKVEEVGKGKVIKGFYVYENQILDDQWYLKYYPAYFTSYARGNDYRMYLYNYDVGTFRSSIGSLGRKYQPILYKVIQPNFPLDTSIQDNIRENDITIVWIRKGSKYLNAFKDKVVLHELKDYYVYHVNPSGI